MKKYLLSTIVLCLLVGYPAAMCAATAQTATSEDPSIYTVSEIMQIYDNLGLSSGETSTNIYFVHGYVTKWKSGYPDYQNADFFIDDSADGSQSLLECFRLKASDDADKRALSVGEYVEVTGYLQNYNGKAEMVNGTFSVQETPGGQGGGESVVDGKCHPELEGLKGTQIRDALYSQIVNHTVLEYIDVRGDKALVDLRSDGTIWDIYSSCSFNRWSYCGNGDNYLACECYNREHILPQSWWGNDNTQPMRFDLHNVYPTDYEANSNRSAWPYAEVTGSVDWSNELGSKVGYNYGYSSTVFEPADEYKGDIARIYFYMATCYKDKKFSQGGKGYLMFSWSGSECSFTTKALTCLLKWHRDDPVSQKETDRNDKVAKKQGNRNPFVDDPDLVEYIWGDKKNVVYACQKDGVEELTVSNPANVTKIILDGHLYIQRDGCIYSITGERVK